MRRARDDQLCHSIPFFISTVAEHQSFRVITFGADSNEWIELRALTTTGIVSSRNVAFKPVGCADLVYFHFSCTTPNCKNMKLISSRIRIREVR